MQPTHRRPQFESSLVAAAAPFPRALPAQCMVLAAVLVWGYLLALGLLSDGLLLAGRQNLGKADLLGTSAASALAIGILSAAIVQSSSLATSLIAGAVAAGAIGLGSGIHGIVGANIGTSLTALLVCLRFSHQRAEFERALAGAFMHTIFKCLTAIVVVALEILGGRFTGAMERFSSMREAAAKSGAFGGPAIVAGPVQFMTRFVIDDLGFSETLAGRLLATIGFTMMIGSLLGLMSLMKYMLGGSIERTLASVMRGGRFASFLAGVLVTVLLQSSTLVTSLTVPLFASGILDRRRGFGIIVGANVGTTLKLLLASATTRSSAWDIALAHFGFNILGAAIWFATPFLHTFVPSLASAAARIFSRRPRTFVAVVVGVYFLVPILCLLLG